MSDTTIMQFLQDPERFEDCAADYMLFPGESLSAGRYSCSEVREAMQSFVEATENGWALAEHAAALSLANLLMGNINSELERSSNA